MLALHGSCPQLPCCLECRLCGGTDVAAKCQPWAAKHCYRAGDYGQPGEQPPADQGIAAAAMCRQSLVAVMAWCSGGVSTTGHHQPTTPLGSPAALVTTGHSNAKGSLLLCPDGSTNISTRICAQGVHRFGVCGLSLTADKLLLLGLLL